jgi:hypothetical protein
MRLLVLNHEFQILKELLPETSFLEVILAEELQSCFVKDVLKVFKLHGS